jgi:hypothetical protein
VLGWGPSAVINRWVPSSVQIREPRLLSYITADTGGELKNCFGASDPSPLALCTTATGKIIMWSHEIQRINFTSRFGIPELDRSTNPSLADIRQTIPQRNIVDMHDENPYYSGFVVVQYSPTYASDGAFQGVSIAFLPSGQTSSEATVATVMDRIRSISVSCMVAHTVLVTEAGQTFYLDRGFLGFLPPPFDMVFELSAFININFTQVISFSRRRTDLGAPVQWIDFAETQIDTAMQTIGHLGLSVDNKLFWTGRAPLAEWEYGIAAENLTAANLIDLNMLFSPTAPPKLRSIHGKYDWFFLVDESNETWTFGDMRFGCGCQPASNTTLARAAKVNGISEVQWIFPLVKYFDRNLTISQFVDDDVDRGTVFVSSTRILYCGSPDIWPNLNNISLPQSCNSSNPIVKASFSALTGLIQLQNGELWSVGAPDEYPARSWKRYDQLGALKAKNFASIVALNSGGAAVSSCALFTELTWKRGH